MNKTITITFLYFISIYSSTDSLKLPTNWPRCPRKGDTGECYKKSIEIALKDLKNGNKALGLIPLEPLHFKVMNIQQGGSSQVNINMTFYNIDVSGSSGVEVTRAKVDWDQYKIEIYFKLNNPLSMEGDYSIKGKVLVLPVNGEGNANITLYDVTGKLTLNGKEVVKDKKQYFETTSSQFQFDATRCTAYFSNLFKEAKNIGERINIFLNDNWPVVLEELREPISDVIGETATQLSKEFFQRVPISNIVAS